MGQKWIVPIVVLVLVIFLLRINEMSTRMRTFEQFISQTTDPHVVKKPSSV